MSSCMATGLERGHAGMTRHDIKSVYGLEGYCRRAEGGPHSLRAIVTGTRPTEYAT